jgi:ferritin-like metal-binding protein YciE
MTLATMQDLLVEGLRDMYHAEKQLVKALPKLADGTSSPTLREAFQNHLVETETHVERIEKAFEQLGLPARGKPCKGMEGLVAEGAEVLKGEGTDPVVDAGLISAAQKVEHYEISAYGSLITFAELLGEDEVAHLLEQTLEEEKKADVRLSGIAMDEVNPMAVAAGAGAEE